MPQDGHGGTLRCVKCLECYVVIREKGVDAGELDCDSR